MTLSANHFQNIFIIPDRNSVPVQHQLLIPPSLAPLVTTLLLSVYESAFAR